MTAVRGIVAHHTAGPATGNYPSLGIVRDNALAQLGLARDGSVLVIAAGLCWHAGRGAWPGLLGNDDTVGIEGESVGTRDDWTPAQRAGWPRLTGALAQWYRVPSRLVLGHREWAPTRKIDPAFINMDQLRAAVAAWNPEDDIVTPEDRKAIAAEVWGYIIAKRGTIGPASAETWLTHTASMSTTGAEVSQHTDAAVAPMPGQLTAIGATADDVQAKLGAQGDTITAAITAAIREATGGSIDETIVRQAVHDAVSQLTITLPDDAA